MSINPLASRATHTVVTKSATYLRKSRARTASPGSKEDDVIGRTAADTHAITAPRSFGGNPNRLISRTSQMRSRLTPHPANGDLNVCLSARAGSHGSSLNAMSRIRRAHRNPHHLSLRGAARSRIGDRLCAGLASEKG